jgi:hypothetical protein
VLHSDSIVVPLKLFDQLAGAVTALSDSMYRKAISMSSVAALAGSDAVMLAAVANVEIVLLLNATAI